MKSLVLITGTGASRNLGKDERPLPLMNDWSRDLIKALDGILGGLAAAVGLHPDMRGDEFEDVLGAFLEWQQTLDLTERFASFGGPSPGHNYGEVQAWLQQSRWRGTQVMEAIHHNLFENFGAGRIAASRATDAYGRLLSFLGPPSDNRIVCATTNYDLSLEMFFEASGLRVLDGMDRSSIYRTNEFRPQGIVGQCREDKQKVPVLHLHGAVGWYRTESGAIEAYPPDKPYNSTLGVPALLLPDPKEDPSLYAGVNDLWREFADALETASHVIVVGHSLNDRHLVSEVRKHTLNALVAVTTYVSSEESDEQLETKKARILQLIPDASVFPLKFGPELEESDVPSEFVAWAKTQPANE